ncbi:MAG: NlpC/P60 family protein [Gammaproteobacteria bacterium]
MKHRLIGCRNAISGGAKGSMDFSRSLVLTTIRFVHCRLKVVLLTTLVLLLCACANRERGLEQSLGFDSATMKQALYTQFDEWRSVRYRLGGLSKAGVDCSGFVYLTYRDLFNVILPRTVYQQAGFGEEVSKWELKTGDLVFFRTGRSRNHVGIYLEHGRFLHASSHGGVTISTLENQYWSRTYWKAIRLFSS